MGRQQRHRKRVKHFHVAGHFHELTFSCFRRKPLLTNDTWRSILSDSIDHACRQEGFQLNAFVFMPEHVHLLVFPNSPTSNVGRLLARIKQPFSKTIKRMLIEQQSSLLDELTVRERPGKRDVENPAPATVRKSWANATVRESWANARKHQFSWVWPTSGKIVSLDLNNRLSTLRYA